MAAHEISPIDPQIRAEFAGAIRRAGLILDGEPVMDGMLHRVPVADGKPRAKDGTYVGFTDGRPAGFIQNFLSGTRETWTSEGKELTQAERDHLATHAQLAKLQRATDLSVQHQTAAERVQAKWDRLSDAPPREENAYLARKGVEAFGVKFNGEKLVVPARDAEGKLWSLQNISADEGGPKLFEKGGRKTGNFHLIGEPKPGEPILVAEGYATGASLHQASGRTVAIAFDSGNIDPVVAALRKRHPESALFVMGDDDHRQKVNVGVEKALSAAQKHQVGVAFPVFDVRHGVSDFNDLHATQGLPAVKAQVDAVVSMTMEQSRTAAQARFAPSQNVEAAASAPTHKSETTSPSTTVPALATDVGRLSIAAPADAAPAPGDRLTKADAAVGAAHVAQLTGVGGEAGHTVAQAVGAIDATRVAADLIAGKDVRALDVGAAAASVTLTAGVGGAEIQSAAQLVAGASALDATRRTINTLETSEPAQALEPTPNRTVPIPQLSAEAVKQVVSPALVAREATHPEVDGGALMSSINHRNADAMAAPRNSVPVDIAAAWVAQDIADLSQVKGDAQRAEALFKIGQNAQEQGHYKTALARQEPDVAHTAAASYMELSAHLIAAQRDESRPAWLQEQELLQMGERHAQVKRDAGSVDQLPKERIDTIAQEDVLTMQRLRGDAREPAAYQLVAEALKNEAYRESFSREVLRLPQSLALADADTFALGESRRRAVEATDAVHVKAVERRSDDLQAVAVNGLGSSVARDLVRLDLDALRATEQPWERLTIAERMAANANVQAAYKAEVVRQDPEVARSIEQFQQAGRSVHVIVAYDRPHITGARPADQPTSDDWALPLLVRGTFASERQGQLAAVPISAEIYAQTLTRAESPVWDNRQFTIAAASGLVGDFKWSHQDPVVALARSRGMLLEDDPIARYIKVQPPAPDRAAQPAQTQEAAAPANSVEQRSREQQYDDAGTVALRKRIAQSNAAVLNDPAKLGAGDRTIETLSRMTRKELEAFEQAIKRSPDQVQTLLTAAQKRIEGDVELRVGRDPVPPLHERYNIIPHLASRDYLFRDKPGTAFTEGWLTLKSAHDTADVIKAMLDRADQRGWTAVNFNGSSEFKRQAWIAATARGIRGVGHTPTDGDRVAADNERKRLGREPAPAQAPTGGSITRGTRPEFAVDLQTGTAPTRTAADLQAPAPQTKALNPAGGFSPDAPALAQRPGGGEPPVAQQVRTYMAGLGETPANIDAIAAVAASKMPNDRVYVGLVTARDYAPYEFKEHAKESPYVKLQGPDGERTIWGVDLPRALDDAGVRLGDSIALEFRGMRAVSVPVKDLDKAGQVVGWHDETVNRNAWYAAKVDDLRAEALKPAPTPSAPVVRDGMPQPVEAAPERKAPDRLASQPIAPTPLPVVGTMPTQPPAHAPTGDGGLDGPKMGAKQAVTGAIGDAPQAAIKPALLGKDADAPALAAFAAALKQKNVPAALHEPLREIFGRELAVRQARGEGVAVNVYDAAAKREATRLPVVTGEPKQTRGDRKISR